MRIILALLVGLLASTTSAQTAADHAWIVEVLDSPEWEVREAFTRQLEDDPEIELRDIEALIHDDRISAEARLRLAQVAKARFFQSSRAAVGMGPMDTSIRLGVTVGRLQDGFDAKRVLRRGDKLIQAQGRPVRDWDRFRALILSNDPGDTFDVLVVRDGETFDLAFTLGRYSSLDNRDPIIDRNLLEEAWQIRMADVLNERFGQTADTGFGAEPMWRQEKLIAQADWPTDADRGTTRNRFRRTVEPNTMPAGHQAVFDWGRLERVRAGVDGDDVATEQETVEIFRGYLAQQEKRMEALRERLNDPNLDDRSRRITASQIERLTPAIDYLKRQIAEVDVTEPGG